MNFGAFAGAHGARTERRQRRPKRRKESGQTTDFSDDGEREEDDRGSGGAAATAHVGNFGVEEQTTYRYAPGDDSDSDAAWTRRVRRRASRRATGSSSDAEDERDAARDSDSDSDSDGLTDSWMNQSFSAAVRGGRNSGGAHATADNTCWGCRHGITGSAECAHEGLRPICSFVNKYYGTMDDRSFSQEISKLQILKIAKPKEQAGQPSDRWEPADVLLHFKQHTLHPRIRNVQRLRTLRAVSAQLRSRVLRVSDGDGDADGGEECAEVNRPVVDMLMRVMDRETQLYRAAGGDLFPQVQSEQQ